jgi:competence protein ComEC
MPSLRNINNTIPIFRHTISFILGIMASEIISFISLKRIHLPLILLTLLATIVLSSIKISKPFRHQKLFSIYIVTIIFFMGMIHASYFQQNQFRKSIPTQATYTGCVLEVKPSVNKRQQLTIEIKSATLADTVIHNISERVVVYGSDSASIYSIVPGDDILFEGRLFPIKSNNNPGDFDYKRYMQNKGIRYQSYVSKPIIKVGRSNPGLRTMAINTRLKLLAEYRKAQITGNEFAVLAALTLGEKSFLDRDLKTQFSNSGAMHVLAVSGLHVGIIFMVFSFLLKPLTVSKKGRIMRTIIIILLLWAYAFITGLSPSVMRAATMFSFIVAGQSLKRRTNIFNTIAFSALVLMLINPKIVYEVGFQLSYAAVLSIVYFQPRIAALLPVKKKLPEKAWSLFAVSVAAQIGTLPFSLYYFNQFPTYFWMSNFVVIPAATLLLYSALLFFTFSFIPVISGLIATFMIWIIKGMNWSIEVINNLPLAVISNISIDKTTVIILIAILILPAISYQANKAKSSVIFLMLLTIFITNSALNTAKTQKQNLIVIYNTYNEKLLSIIDGRNHYYYHNSDTLSSNSDRMLSDAKSFFHTNDPIPISGVNISKLKYSTSNSTIFYKDITLKITPYLKGKSSHLNQSNIIWATNDSKFNVNKNVNISLHMLKNGKLIYFRQNFEENHVLLDTLNSALLIKCEK